MKAPNRNKAALDRRRREAGERAVALSQLTPAQRIQRLDKALGVGIGAKKERARLALAMGAKPVPVELASAVFVANAKENNQSDKKARRSK